MSATRRNYCVSPGLLSLSSTTGSVHYFTYGGPLPETRERHELAVGFSVHDDLSRPGGCEETFHRYHWCDEVVYYERVLLYGIEARMVFRPGPDPHLAVNRDYARYVRLRLDNCLSPGQHLTDVTTTHLLRNGYAPLHCSSFSSDGAATVVMAPPDTGKTLTARNAVRAGHEFLAEDIAITDGERVFPCPYTSTLTDGGSLRSGILRHVPVLSYVFGTSKQFDDVEDAGNGDAAPLETLVVLGRGDEDVRRLGRSEALRRVTLLNGDEFAYRENPLLSATAYFDDRFSSWSPVESEHELLRAVVDAAEVYEVTSRDPTRYFDMIHEEI